MVVQQRLMLLLLPILSILLTIFPLTSSFVKTTTTITTSHSDILSRNNNNNKKKNKWLSWPILLQEQGQNQFQHQQFQCALRPSASRQTFLSSGNIHDDENERDDDDDEYYYYDHYDDDDNDEMEIDDSFEDEDDYLEEEDDGDDLDEDEYEYEYEDDYDEVYEDEDNTNNSMEVEMNLELQSEAEEDEDEDTVEDNNYDDDDDDDEYDSMVEQLKQAMLRNPSQSQDIVLFQLYETWRETHFPPSSMSGGRGRRRRQKNKQQQQTTWDTNRFIQFKTNYMNLHRLHQKRLALAKVERWKELPKFPELNQYADLTQAEYHRILQKEQQQQKQKEQKIQKKRKVKKRLQELTTRQHDQSNGKRQNDFDEYGDDMGDLQELNTVVQEEDEKHYNDDKNDNDEIDEYYEEEDEEEPEVEEKLVMEESNDVKEELDTSIRADIDVDEEDDMVGASASASAPVSNNDQEENHTPSSETIESLKAKIEQLEQRLLIIQDDKAKSIESSEKENMKEKKEETMTTLTSDESLPMSKLLTEEEDEINEDKDEDVIQSDVANIEAKEVDADANEEKDKQNIDAEVEPPPSSSNIKKQEVSDPYTLTSKIGIRTSTTSAKTISKEAKKKSSQPKQTPTETEIFAPTNKKDKDPETKSLEGRERKVKSNTSKSRRSSSPSSSSSSSTSKEDPQVIFWESNGSATSSYDRRPNTPNATGKTGRSRMNSATRAGNGIRGSYVGKTKHAIKTMPPITVKATSDDDEGEKNRRRRNNGERNNQNRNRRYASRTPFSSQPSHSFSSRPIPPNQQELIRDMTQPPPESFRQYFTRPSPRTPAPSSSSYQSRSEQSFNRSSQKNPQRSFGPIAPNKQELIRHSMQPSPSTDSHNFSFQRNKRQPVRPPYKSVSRSIPVDNQEIVRDTEAQLSSHFAAMPPRPAISKSSKRVPVDNRGIQADRMAVDFPRRVPVPPPRGMTMVPGISDQETKLPPTKAVVDPSTSTSSSYHTKSGKANRDSPQLSVPGVSDQETNGRAGGRIDPDSYSQGPTQRQALSENKRPLSNISNKARRRKIGIKKPVTGRTTTTRKVASLDPSTSYNPRLKDDLKKMAKVPYQSKSKESTDKKDNRLDSTSRQRRRVSSGGFSLSDQVVRAPADRVNIESFSQAGSFTGTFRNPKLQRRGTPKTLGRKPSFQVRLSEDEEFGEEFDDEEEYEDEYEYETNDDEEKTERIERDSSGSLTPSDQDIRGPSMFIHPESIHASHWP